MKKHLEIRYHKNYINKCICIILALFLFLPLGIVSKAAPGVPLKDKYGSADSKDIVEYEGSEYSETSYLAVKGDYEEKGYKAASEIEINLGVEDINLPNGNVASLEKGIGDKDEPVFIWEEDCEWIEWEVDIDQEGLYNIFLEYFPLKDTGVDISREIMINGKSPFSEAHNIAFSRMWQDEGEPKVNVAGDEVIPRQKEVQKWVMGHITDINGIYSEPFQFYFHEGINTIRMNYINQPMAVGNMIVKSPDIIPNYEEVQNEYREKGYKEGNKSIKFQAEDKTAIKSDPTVRIDTNGDPTVEPRSIENVKLNVIGGTRWQAGNQWITWVFDVPEDGLYKIALRLGQWWGDGLPTYRHITIDGKVPFKEMEEYKFEFGQNWRTEVLQDSSENPYLFYLTEGPHEITMTVKAGPYGEIMEDLTNNIELLSKMILDITMITGENPDINYEYDLHLKISDLMDNLKEISQNLADIADALDQLSNRRLPVVSNLESIKLQLDEMIKDPEMIPRKLNDLTEAQTSLGTWIENLAEQPLILDYFEILPKDAEVVDSKSNIFQRVNTTFKNFVASFYKDYDNVSGIETEVETLDDSEPLDVWVGMGREAAQLLKELADSDFTLKTGIGIKMNVIPSSQLNAGGMGVLLLSIVSGNAPDVALGLSSDTPVEFAIRNAVKALTDFDDFDSTYEQFLPGIMIPYEYNGKFYALPQTMGFNILFYRKDIMNELNLSVPDTWSEVREDLLPKLYQNKMTFPAGSEGTTFGAFLLQNGGQYYNDDRTLSGFDTPEALAAFTEWTELYTNFGVPVSANFFNRFRTGTSPIGVGGYDLYMKLLVAAPELLGKWGVALMPGTEKPNGEIDRSAVGGATGQSSIIMEQSEKQDEAWEFLKWWTSTETQVNFGREIEALLGPEARYNSANIEAFDGLPWIEEDIKKIKEQWVWNREQPVVPGGYFTDRHLTNAFTRTVMTGEKARDSMEKAVEDINKELRAKQEEFGIGIYKDKNQDKESK